MDVPSSYHMPIAIAEINFKKFFCLGWYGTRSTGTTVPVVTSHSVTVTDHWSVRSLYCSSALMTSNSNTLVGQLKTNKMNATVQRFGEEIIILPFRNFKKLTPISKTTIEFFQNPFNSNTCNYMTEATSDPPTATALSTITRPIKDNTKPIVMTKLKDPEAQKLFLSGKSILEELESSDLFQNHSGNDWLNHYPAFDISEIVVGPVLGHGGFGIVNEVQDIVLSSDNDSPSSRTNINHTLNPIVVYENDDATTESDSDTGKIKKNNRQRRHKTIEGSDYFDSNTARSYLSANVRRRCTTPSLLTLNGGNKMINKNKSMISMSSNSNDKNNTASTSTAARYAIKRLKSDLNELNRVRGAIDLAIEVKILSRLHHPNIGKLQFFL
jgi:hypothetical protein